MYEERYGTDWAALGVVAAIDRAYALGILAELDEALPAEYDRVRAAIDVCPGSDLVELAYEEGPQAVADIDVSDRNDRDAWDALIEDEDAGVTRGGGDGTDAEKPPSSAPPSSLSALAPPDDDPEMLEFPDFLRRE